MHKVTLEPAYILHTRAFKETSLLLEVFSQSQGRVNLIAKGVKRNKSAKSALLQPFIPLLLSYTGKSDLQTLTQVELLFPRERLQGHYLLSGFYVNELLMKLLHKHDPHPDLFSAYNQLLLAFTQQAPLEPELRQFELRLLMELGYALSAAELDPTAQYYFAAETGFIKTQTATPEQTVFQGAALIEILSADRLNNEILPTAKTLMRTVLQTLLHDKPLFSRTLF